MPVMQHLLVAPRCVSFYTTKAIRGKERIQMCKMYLRNFTRFLCPKMSRISFVRLQAVIGVEGGGGGSLYRARGDAPRCFWPKCLAADFSLSWTPVSLTHSHTEAKTRKWGPRLCSDLYWTTSYLVIATMMKETLSKTGRKKTIWHDTLVPLLRLTHHHEGCLPPPQGTTLVVGAGDPRVGSLYHFTRNIDIWALFDPKNVKIHPRPFQNKRIWLGKKIPLF